MDLASHHLDELLADRETQPDAERVVDTLVADLREEAEERLRLRMQRLRRLRRLQRLQRL